MALATRYRVTPSRAWTTEKTTGQPNKTVLLTNGLVAMQTLGDWYFPSLDAAKGTRWDAVPMPYAPRTKKTGSIANLRGLVIPPTSQQRELGWAWIAYLLTREVQDRIPSLMGEVPARTDSIDQVYLNPAKLPTPKSRKLLKVALDATVPYPAHPTIAWADVNGALNTLNDVYDGKREAREVLAEIQQKLTALLTT
jgi:ABC-type glycerol-3-phosphate transport system substrate-binding protein